jgi:Uma2 family endonuclease
MAIAIPRHRFSVDEYHRMAESGILAPTQRVELIEGEIVDMTPIGRRHVACVARLSHVFIRGVGDRAVVLVQSPLRLVDHSEPEPDLVVLRPRADFYAGKDAGPQDVLLVIEVADISEHYDRHVKVPLDARHGIPEVWLVDLTAGSLTIYC